MPTGWVKKGLPMLLSVALVGMLAACSSKENKEGSSSVASTQTTSEHPSATSSETPKKELTVSMWPVTFAQNFPSGVQEDPVAKDILEKTKIKIDVESHPTDDKFQALMASGDLPEVIIPEGTSNYVKQLIEGEQLIDLEPYLEKHAPDILKNAADAIEYAKKYQSNGTGKLYFIPSGVFNKPNEKPENNAIIGPFLRWDYYQEIGAPALNTYDDFLNAVDAMLKKHPTNEEGQKFYGFSQWFDWDIWGIAMFPSWMEGKDYFPGGLYQVDRETLEMESMLTSKHSVMWSGVDFWNKAYKMGLLDPDALTQKYDTAIQKGASNRVLAAIASWQLRDSNALLSKAGMPEKGYTPVPLPMMEGKNIYAATNPFGGSSRMWAVTKNAKAPERAVELINYFYNIANVETLYNGIQGVDWIEENGKKLQTEAQIKGLQTDPNYVLTSGAGKYTNIIGLASGFVNPDRNETVQIRNRQTAIQNLSPLDKSITEHYKVELPVDIVPNGYKLITSNVGVVYPFMPVANDDIKRIDDKIMNYLQSALAKMILLKDETKYQQTKEKIIADIQALDYETSFNWYSQSFAEAMEKAKPFLK